MSDSDDPRRVGPDADADSDQRTGDARTVLLLTESTVVAERQVCERQLSADDVRDTSVLAVTYTEALDDVVEKVWESLGDLPADLGVISFDDMTRSAATTDGYRRSEGPITVTTMSDPENLKALGSAMRLYLDDWTDRSTHRILCFSSLTHLLWHVSVDDAVQFLRGVETLLHDTNSVGHFHLDPQQFDDQVVERLRAEFDEVIDDVGATDDEPELTTDVIHRLLGNERRRYILAYLGTAELSVTMRTLTERIAAWEQGVDESELSPFQTERVRTSLTTSHVPLLKDANVIEADDDGDVLRLTDEARENETLTTLLQMAADEYDLH
jgi:hypothetical protein